MDLDRFCRRYLEQWDERATVRGLARYRVSEAETARELFPARLQPLAAHRLVRSRGAGTARELLIRTAYQWQSDIAALEVEVVADLCGKLANEGPGCAIPDSTRQVALTIATDETYHAFVAREFIADVERVTGFEPPALPGSEPALVKGVRVTREGSPAELRREVETMALCFAEHFVTESLFGLSKETEPDNAFHVAVREHLIDEGRHQGFFRHLMGHLWAGLDEERRIALGRAAPLFLDAFLCDFETIGRSNIRMLSQCGFTPEEADRINRDTARAMARGKRLGKAEMPHAQHCLVLARAAGLLGHAPTREAFIERGWIVPEACGAA
ncbi:P-aminobenzoate N-oxygenase AurF [Tistlia consotensis]|uniref:p-aminobenzoate N-oxygenase AurF n=1 Tax=Tistlia consotensis USBA 355 TaxID=560819 RepID=A0A1Y6BNL4_9PROT|nr:diiron oxygenase [Tistlia consotensis]SMF12108.1 P-aminobenzoate N-oxygenase AurF [Tistlia consotensis USBA 355]SNR51361.1 P-aminobenzoate N-oxygenase AurF [Tistlia consotensis]